MQAEKQFTLTNLRYYNWEQEAAEKAFDAKSNIVREAIADKNSQGLVVDISADYYNEGDTVLTTRTAVRWMFISRASLRRSTIQLPSSRP